MINNEIISIKDETVKIKKKKFVKFNISYLLFFLIIIGVIIYIIELKRYYKKLIEKYINIEERLETCYKTRVIFYTKARENFMLNQNIIYNESNLVTIQDKLSYLTIHESPDYKSKLVDKILLHDYSKKILGKDICVPILKIYNNSSDINLDELPDKFVLKCNHGSAMNIICNNKEYFDLIKAKIILNKWMSENYGTIGYEFQYLNVEKKIFAETFLKDNIEDYKVYCFHGEPKFIRVQKEIEGNVKINNYYDLDWKLTDIETGKPDYYRISNYTFQKPKKFKLMIEYAKKLSSEFAFVRVDFYEFNDRIYLGELTFTPSNAIFNLKNREQCIYLGNLIDLKKIKKEFFN